MKVAGQKRASRAFSAIKGTLKEAYARTSKHIRRSRGLSCHIGEPYVILDLQ